MKVFGDPHSVINDEIGKWDKKWFTIGVGELTEYSDPKKLSPDSILDLDTVEVLLFPLFFFFLHLTYCSFLSLIFTISLRFHEGFVVVIILKVFETIFSLLRCSFFLTIFSFIDFLSYLYLRAF